jgi:hypothetical protein
MPADLIRADLAAAVDFCHEPDRDLPLKWVSRCCFMLSARVNFFWQPAYEQATAFSAVWILEWRDAWPEVVKVLSHPCVSRKRHGYLLGPLSVVGGFAYESES